jgi:hypothetical protein
VRDGIRPSYIYSRLAGDGRPRAVRRVLLPEHPERELEPAVAPLVQYTACGDLLKVHRDKGSGLGPGALGVQPGRFHREAARRRAAAVGGEHPPRLLPDQLPVRLK